MIKKTKEHGKHDYSGMCTPEKWIHPSAETFSVGVFQWVWNANGTRLKKSPVKYRVKGKVSDAQKVYDRAKEICLAFDADPSYHFGRRSETVK